MSNTSALAVLNACSTLNGQKVKLTLAEATAIKAFGPQMESAVEWQRLSQAKTAKRLYVALAAEGNLNAQTLNAGDLGNLNTDGTGAKELRSMAIDLATPKVFRADHVLGVREAPNLTDERTPNPFCASLREIRREFLGNPAAGGMLPARDARLGVQQVRAFLISNARTEFALYSVPEQTRRAIQCLCELGLARELRLTNRFLPKLQAGGELLDSANATPEAIEDLYQWGAPFVVAAYLASYPEYPPTSSPNDTSTINLGTLLLLAKRYSDAALATIRNQEVKAIKKLDSKSMEGEVAARVLCIYESQGEISSETENEKSKIDALLEKNVALQARNEALEAAVKNQSPPSLLPPQSGRGRGRGNPLSFTRNQRNTCNSCGGFGHFSRDCPSGGHRGGFGQSRGSYRGRGGPHHPPAYFVPPPYGHYGYHPHPSNAGYYAHV